MAAAADRMAATAIGRWEVAFPFVSWQSSCHLWPFTGTTAVGRLPFSGTSAVICHQLVVHHLLFVAIFWHNNRDL